MRSSDREIYIQDYLRARAQVAACERAEAGGYYDRSEAPIVRIAIDYRHTSKKAKGSMGDWTFTVLVLAATAVTWIAATIAAWKRRLR